MRRVFMSYLRLELQTLWRSTSQWLHPVLFFIIFISLFGFALGSEPGILAMIAPSMIWVAFLLSALFSIDTLFRVEAEEGGLALLLLSPYPLWWLILAKSLAVWLVICAAITLFMPVLTILLPISIVQASILLLSLYLGSPAIVLLAMMGAAMTIQISRSGIFLALLLLPLMVPILILGESTIISLLSTEGPSFQLILLAAISLSSITLIPHAIAAALQVGTD